MRTIRGKLTLAFLLIIIVCLVPTSTAAAYVIRRYQRQDALERLTSFGQTVAGAMMARQFSQISPTETVSLFKEQKNSGGEQKNNSGEIIITDARGIVLADSENRYVGMQWAIPTQQTDVRTVPVRPEYTGKLAAPDGTSLAVATFHLDRRGRFGPSAPPGGNAPEASQVSYVVVAIPWASTSDAWSVIGPRLQGIVAATLFLAILLAFVLSRSLTSRLGQLTHGANAMAGGDYRRAMELTEARASNDEIGNLVYAFRTMATNVARAQQAQRDLVANVSHELKTPLTSIQGFSQAMIDGTVTAESEHEDLARIIQQESQRMRRLVEQMLELSRLESGTVHLETAPLRADELVANIGKRYTRLGEAAGVTVRWAAPPNLALNADGGRLEQVLVNLLDNALQYTDTGGLVTLYARSARPNRVEFVIQDTGKGIPPEDVPRLFERFYQVERSRSGQGRHVGLGLAIVREIVDAHQGRIMVHSELDVGTSITVSIPTNEDAHQWSGAYRQKDALTTEPRATVAG